MNGSTYIRAWVTEETKQRFVSAARRANLSESALLKKLVDNALVLSHEDERVGDVTPEVATRDGRLTIRLRPEDRLLLRGRAKARSMTASMYASVVLRSHVRQLEPLPDKELSALEYVASELGAVGRNLNQIARAANQGRVAGPSRDDLRMMLRVCEALRKHVKDLVEANTRSWRRGHAESEH